MERSEPREILQEQAEVGFNSLTRQKAVWRMPETHPVPALRLLRFRRFARIFHSVEKPV